MEPRLIRPGEIRVGDRVRGVYTCLDSSEVIEVTVAGFTPYGFIKTVLGREFTTPEATWTLLDRPEPPRYSLWRCTLTGAEYIYVGPDVHEGYMVIKEGKPLPGALSAGVLGGRMLDDPQNTSRLVPLDGPDA